MNRSSRAPETYGSDTGFSPVFDRIAQRYGLVTAAVYGAAWRHCQMRDRVCRASSHRIATLLGVNHTTVQRHLRLLIREGYLEDTTPDRHNRPHVLRLTNLVVRHVELDLEQAGMQEG